MKALILSSLLALVVALSQSPAALAVKPEKPGGGSTTGVTSPLGNDVSYPQCGGRLPSGQAFGIVGVNNGLANTTNPCFAEQLAWAEQSSGASTLPGVALYVNTANPGLAAKVWPENNMVKGELVLSDYGTCDHTEGAACAYIYGYTRAYEDANERGVSNPSQYTWWLDVETGNSWSDTDLIANAASLEGMVDYFTSINVAGIGIYSTHYQWNTIVGNLRPDSSLNGLKSWLAGARSERAARANCTLLPLTTNGIVSVTQFVSKGLDYDVSCQG